MDARSANPQEAPPCQGQECCSRPAAQAAGQNPAAGAWAGLKRWLLWFLTFFGLYASSSVCPFCGTPGCPVGAGGAAAAGGFFALLWHGLRVWPEKLKALRKGGKGQRSHAARQHRPL